MANDATLVAVAVIAAVPATVAAWNSRKSKKNTKTSNGHTLGQLLEMHTIEDRHNARVIAAYVGVPEDELLLGTRNPVAPIQASDLYADDETSLEHP